MKTWVTVTLAAVAAALLVVAAAVLIVQEDEDGPAPADDFPETPDEEPEEDEPGRPLETEASINVTEAWIDEGDCISVAQEEDDGGSEQGDRTQDDGQQPTDGQAQQDQEDGQDDGPVGGGQQVCHRLRVTVTAHSDRPFLVGVGLWEAVDTEGGEHNASWVRSPDPLDAGGTRSVVVSFDATDDVRMLTLRYEDPDGPTLTTGVGAYEDELTEDEVVEAR